MDKKWVVYMLECGDGSLYTGITDDFQRRYKMHTEGKGAKYTRGRGPLVPRFQEECEDHSTALKREIAIKRLSRQEKLQLCDTWQKQENQDIE